MINYFTAGKSVQDVHDLVRENPDLSLFITQKPDDPIMLESVGGKFTKDVKGAAFIRDALPGVAKCPTCNGIMHRNGMQVGHAQARRLGGTGELANAQMQHPFCNSTVAN